MLQLTHDDKLLIYFERNLISQVLQNKRLGRIYVHKLLFYNNSVIYLRSIRRLTKFFRHFVIKLSIYYSRIVAYRLYTYTNCSFRFLYVYNFYRPPELSKCFLYKTNILIKYVLCLYTKRYTTM